MGILGPLDLPEYEESSLAQLLELAIRPSFGPTLLDELLLEWDAQTGIYPSPARAAAFGLFSALQPSPEHPRAVEIRSDLPGSCLTDEGLRNLFAPIPILGIRLNSRSSAIVTFRSASEAEAAVSVANSEGIFARCLALWDVSLRPPGAVRKYTCRFDIGIENDKEFHVARRIIGQKGANMKRIVKHAGFDAKLRLRGKGSGFLEGVNKQESDEPLHLCVSCKEAQGYQTAVALVTALLDEVYAEYHALADKGLLPPKEDLKVVLHEHPLLYSGPVPTVADHTVLPEPATPSDTEAPRIDEIERLIEERNEARRVCNFKEADRIRDILRNYGVGLMDEPGGRGRGTEVTSWRFWKS